MARKYLTRSQETVLRKIVQDFKDRPITMTLDELAVLYDSSFDTMRRIFRFLRTHKMVEVVRCGWRHISIFTKEIFEYLKCPLEWIAKNSVEVRL